MQNVKSSYKVRVFMEDTDANQVVYHPNYLKYAERARSQLLESMGVLKSKLQSERKLRFVVYKTDVDYTSPAFLDDELQVTTVVHEVTPVTLTMQQEILRGTTLLVRLLVKLALINENLRPVRWPEFLREEFLKLTLKSE
jgi:acyl-CoA thioester hydrolase